MVFLGGCGWLVDFSVEKWEVVDTLMDVVERGRLL